VDVSNENCEIRLALNDNANDERADGDHDWMDPQGGYKSVENLRNAGNPNGKMFIVPRAGHHVYLDNVKATNDLIVKELDSSP
jgi:pimeloyl-ACP methyl ester carboxylesterase